MDFGEPKTTSRLRFPHLPDGQAQARSTPESAIQIAGRPPAESSEGLLFDIQGIPGVV